MGFNNVFIRIKGVPLQDIEKHNAIKDLNKECFYEGWDLIDGLDWVSLNFWEVHGKKVEYVGYIDNAEIHKLFVRKLGLDIKQTNALIISMDKERIDLLIGVVTSIYNNDKEYVKHIVEELEQLKKDTTDLYYEADW